MSWRHAFATCLCFVGLSLSAQAQFGSPEMAKAQAAAEEKLKTAAALPTPKTADGHPDLTGLWKPAFDPFSLFLTKAVTNDGKTSKPIAGPETQEHKGNLANVAKRQADTASRPAYKPEFMAKAKENFEKAAYLDPSYRCMPLGVPRVGPPNEILQTKTAVYFMYSTSVGSLAPVSDSFRIIPIDGRPHNKEAERMATGDAVGHWEGDTLVVDVTNFNEDTWIDGDGSFHTPDMHVVERLTRKGNTLNYSATLEDPKVMAKPFALKPVTLLVGPAGEHLTEGYPCVEMDQEHLLTNERH